MFELDIVKKYLIPKRKQLSVSLVALLSLFVISLVVWLLLVFLSVTGGIEKAWLNKLTSLNAPITITPTSDYYHSYYYLSDSIASDSNYTLKSLKEKLLSSEADPYKPDEDVSIPEYFPSPIYQDGKAKDLVKDLYACIDKVKDRHNSLVVQDYEVTGALLRLKLIRSDLPSIVSVGQDRQSFLTQMIYVASFSENNPNMPSLLLPPRESDLSHLFYLSTLGFSSSVTDEPEKTFSLQPATLKSRLEDLLSYLRITSLKTPSHHYEIPYDFISENHKFEAYAHLQNGEVYQVVIPSTKKTQEIRDLPNFIQGSLSKKDARLIFSSKTLKEPLDVTIARLFIEDSIELKANLDATSFDLATSTKDLKFFVEGFLQKQKIQGYLKASSLQLSKAEAIQTLDINSDKLPLWPYFTKEDKIASCHLPLSSGKESGTILPKNFQEAGVKIGDKGYLAYNVATATSTQEQRLPIYVAGFYDPGVMSVGAKCLLLHSDVVRDIASATQTLTTDQMMSNGIHVWFNSLKDTKLIQAEIEKELKTTGLDSYFKVQSFHEYDFAKDLLLQFQSDKYLFTLIALIILLVACSNIISFLVLMVNDKKKEIGILSSMGATSKSIATIFAACGACIGLAGCLIGVLGATFTLHHIDKLVSFLSFMQGHDAFNAQFYGGSLPSELSSEALIFILITTPILSILAGAIPAIKATRLKPSEILRSQG